MKTAACKVYELKSSHRYEDHNSYISDRLQVLHQGLWRRCALIVRAASVLCTLALTLSTGALAKDPDRHLDADDNQGRMTVPSKASAEPQDPPALASETSDAANLQGFPGKVLTGEVPTPYGHATLNYQLIRAEDVGVAEDFAITEGDIMLDTSKIQKARDDIHRSVGRVDTDFRWPNGVVPYEIDAAYTAAQQGIINAAINHWNAVTPYWFRPRNGEPDYVRFVRNMNGVCNSLVGRQGGRQVINLDATACGTGAAIHEIGHAVGLWHEQSRADRNNFVLINWGNIQNGQAFNFQTYVQQGADGRDMFDYDYNSIMHYGSFAFARTVSGASVGPTITRLDGSLITANRTALSQGDIAGAVRLLTNDHPQPTFKIINVNSGKCLDVASASQSNGAAVNQYTCHGGANQRWYFWTVPGTNNKLVINDWSGQCLDIPGGSLADGAQLQQYSCHGFGSQQFQTQANWWQWYRFRNANSGKCLDVPNGSTANGVRVQQYSCHSGYNQQWMLIP